ncbi:hypothetical protein EON68_02900, partial [archaeon]
MRTAAVTLGVLAAVAGVLGKLPADLQPPSTGVYAPTSASPAKQSVAAYTTYLHDACTPATLWTSDACALSAGKRWPPLELSRGAVLFARSALQFRLPTPQVSASDAPHATGAAQSARTVIIEAVESGVSLNVHVDVSHAAASAAARVPKVSQDGKAARWSIRLLHDTPDVVVTVRSGDHEAVHLRIYDEHADASAAVLAVGGPAGSPTQLDNGVSITDFVALRSWSYYQFTVASLPIMRLDVVVTPLLGDPDLYVTIDGSTPTLN